MSMSTWHDYGYGINVSKIETTLDKMLDFISLAPSYKSEFEEFLEYCSIDEIKRDGTSIDDIKASLHANGETISNVIANVVYELEHVTLTACSSYAGDDFCLFEPKYLWKMSDAEKALDEKGVKQLFAKYVAYLTDQSLEDLDYDYQEVENCG